MKRNIILIITFLFVCHNYYGQTQTMKEEYFKDFKWKISIPNEFEYIKSEDWEKIRKKGIDSVEKTVEEKVIDEAKTIFVVKSDNLNFFEANYQPFDISKDGSYIENQNKIKSVLYQTFITQMPDIKIDTSSNVEKIDGLEFQTFKIKIEYPNNLILNIVMFSRLFDKKDLTINIMYVDKEKGQLMLDSWRNSKFLK